MNVMNEGKHSVTRVVARGREAGAKPVVAYRLNGERYESGAPEEMSLEEWAEMCGKVKPQRAAE